MTESAPAKPRLSTSAELLIGAVLGTVVGWPITRALDEWATESKLPWWVYILGVAVGIFVVLFAMTFIIKAWRAMVWGNVWRALTWLWSWRPVSARRFNRMVMEQEAASKRAIDTFTSQVARLQATWSKALPTAPSRTTQSPLEGDWPKPLPLPSPRWTIKQNSFDKTELDFILQNHVPRSVAKEVRVEAEGDFNGDIDATILDAGHFEDLSGEASGEFRVGLSPRARVNGTSFEISWYNSGAQRLREVIFVPGWESAQPPQPRASSATA